MSLFEHNDAIGRMTRYLVHGTHFVELREALDAAYESVEDGHPVIDHLNRMYAQLVEFPAETPQVHAPNASLRIFLERTGGQKWSPSWNDGVFVLPVASNQAVNDYAEAKASATGALPMYEFDGNIPDAADLALLGRTELRGILHGLGASPAETQGKVVGELRALIDARRAHTAEPAGEYQEEGTDQAMPPPKPKPKFSIGKPKVANVPQETYRNGAVAAEPKKATFTFKRKA